MAWQNEARLPMQLPDQMVCDGGCQTQAHTSARQMWVCQPRHLKTRQCRQDTGLAGDGSGGHVSPPWGVAQVVRHGRHDEGTGERRARGG